MIDTSVALPTQTAVAPVVIAQASRHKCSPRLRCSAPTKAQAPAASGDIGEGARA